MALDVRKLTQINEDLAAIKNINEVYAGDLMLYHAITEQTDAIYALIDMLDNVGAAICESIEDKKI